MGWFDFLDDEKKTEQEPLPSSADKWEYQPQVKTLDEHNSGVGEETAPLPQEVSDGIDNDQKLRDLKRREEKANERATTPEYEVQAWERRFHKATGGRYLRPGDLPDWDGIKEYQKDRGLAPTGQVDRETMETAEREQRERNRRAKQDREDGAKAKRGEEEKKSWWDWW